MPAPLIGAAGALARQAVVRLGKKLSKRAARRAGKSATRRVREAATKRGAEGDDKKRPWGKWLLVALFFTVLPTLLWWVIVVGVVSSVVGGTAQQTVRASQILAMCGISGASESSRQDPDLLLTPTEIAQYAAAAGFSGDDLVIAVAVALAESGGRPGINNEGLNSDGSVDYGLWQINSVHTASGFEPALAYDPSYNAMWARRIFLNAGSSWTPWTTFNNESYLQYMGRARSAVGDGEVAAPVYGGTCGALLVVGGFPSEIDPYAGYEPQQTCNPTPQPGVVDFANLLLATYPSTGNSGIVRECSIGGISEHKEGRAFDWTADVNNAQQRAAVEDLLARLLATDEHGNSHALLRRFGIMYIIWNRRIITSYNIDAGWQPYSCRGDPSSCHENHVHFSFSWAGALRQTSWWTAGSRTGSGGIGSE